MCDQTGTLQMACKPTGFRTSAGDPRVMGFESHYLNRCSYGAHLSTTFCCPLAGFGESSQGPQNVMRPTGCFPPIDTNEASTSERYAAELTSASGLILAWLFPRCPNSAMEVYACLCMRIDLQGCTVCKPGGLLQSYCCSVGRLRRPSRPFGCCLSTYEMLTYECTCTPWYERLCHVQHLPCV